MCPKQDEIESTELKGLLCSKFERILEAATDGIVTLGQRRTLTPMPTPLPSAFLGVKRAQILQRKLMRHHGNDKTIKGQPLSNAETLFKGALRDGQVV